MTVAELEKCLHLEIPPSARSGFFDYFTGDCVNFDGSTARFDYDGDETITADFFNLHSSEILRCNERSKSHWDTSISLFSIAVIGLVGVYFWRQFQ